MIQQAVAHLRVEGPQTAGLLPRVTFKPGISRYSDRIRCASCSNRGLTSIGSVQAGRARRSAAEPTPRPASASKRGPWQPPAVRSIGTPCAMATTAWRDLLGGPQLQSAPAAAPLSSKLSCRAPPCEILGRAGDCGVVPRLGYELETTRAATLHFMASAMLLTYPSRHPWTCPRRTLSSRGSRRPHCRADRRWRAVPGKASVLGRADLPLALWGLVMAMAGLAWLVSRCGREHYGAPDPSRTTDRHAKARRLSRMRIGKMPVILGGRR